MSEEVHGKHQSPTEKIRTSGCGLGALTDVCKLPLAIIKHSSWL